MIYIITGSLIIIATLVTLLMWSFEGDLILALKVAGLSSLVVSIFVFGAWLIGYGMQTIQ